MKTTHPVREVSHATSASAYFRKTHEKRYTHTRAPSVHLVSVGSANKTYQERRLNRIADAREKKCLSQHSMDTLSTYYSVHDLAFDVSGKLKLCLHFQPWGKGIHCSLRCQIQFHLD